MRRTCHCPWSHESPSLSPVCGDWTDPNSGKKYVTAKKVTDRPTSNTLVTCFCYNRCDAVGRPMDPTPDGLVVRYLDGAARFVKWSHLTPSNHEGDYIVYYDRDK